MTSFFPPDATTSLGKRPRLADISLKGFGGGLYTADNDVVVGADFCVGLSNLYVTPKGALRARFGSNWFADVAAPTIPAQVVTGNIIDARYFANTIIVVTSTGQIAAIDNSGVQAVIWKSSIAALLPGAPSGWTTGLTSVDFVPIKSKLVIHNGVDKPISIDAALGVTYLQDLATGSNTNVPIGRYGCVVSNYHCVAGIAAAPTTIYVSSKGTTGTFPGDAAPNDSISIDVGAYAPEGAPEIRGIKGYRSNLIVFFEGQALIVTLGTYVGDVHTPQFPDTMPSFGILGHRCSTQIENDLLFSTERGIASAKRNLFNLIDSSTLGDAVEPTFRQRLSTVTDTQQLRNCFMLYDRNAHNTVAYLPDGTGFVYSANEKLRYKGWSMFDGPAWVCGCATRLGRVFLCQGTRIFQQGNDIFDGENYEADKLNDRDGPWAPGVTYSVGALIRDTVTQESYTCAVAHISGGVSFATDRAAQALAPKWTLYTGVPIDIMMELPWLDSREPMKTKLLRFLSILTKGAAKFTVKAWVDNLFKDADGVEVYDPALSIEFIGNDAPGFGHDAGPYGGGRRSNDPRLYRFPLKFKSLKIRIEGSITSALEIAAMTFLYSRGGYKR